MSAALVGGTRAEGVSSITVRGFDAFCNEKKIKAYLLISKVPRPVTRSRAIMIRKKVLETKTCVENGNAGMIYRYKMCVTPCVLFFSSSRITSVNAS